MALSKAGMLSNPKSTLRVWEEGRGWLQVSDDLTPPILFRENIPMVYREVKVSEMLSPKQFVASALCVLALLSYYVSLAHRFGASCTQGA